MKDLTYININNEICQLPTWCQDWSDDQIEEAKQICSAAEEPELNISEIDVSDELIDQLLDEFGFETAELIVADISCGRTLDSAIQKYA